MIYSAAIPTEMNTATISHLLRSDRQEDLCFGLWHPSQGRNRLSALLWKVLLPRAGEREVHGNVSFNPGYFERALRLAVKNKAGLLFMHSHMGPGWQDMSGDDIRAEQRISAAVKGATGLPLVGLTLGTDNSWSARFWIKTAPHTYARRWCQSVRVVGDCLRVTYNDNLIPRPHFREELSRTESAWGPEEQSHLMRLHVGVIGAGSVGSMVGEALARMGVAHVSLIDFDTVKLVNLDRLLNAHRRDAILQRSKVAVLGRAIAASATAQPFTVEKLEWSISEEEGFRSALDCDVLFSCVDRPWPRSILNFIANAHLIPVVDGGIRLERKSSGKGLLRADWRAHVVGPSRPCLECLGQYSSGDAATDRDGYYDDPSYIANLPGDHPIKTNANVFGFSLSVAALEVEQFLALILQLPAGIIHHPQAYHFVTASLDSSESNCLSTCKFPSLVGLGDHAPVSLTAPHHVAVELRTERLRFRRSIRYWMGLLMAR